MSRLGYGQEPAESQKDTRNNVYTFKRPQLWQRSNGKKTHLLGKKINLKGLTFEKHPCLNPGLQIFSWWSSEEKYTHPKRFLCKTLTPARSQDQDPTFAISIRNSCICYIFFFCQKCDLNSTPPQTTSLALLPHSKSARICPTQLMLSTCTGLAKTLFLLRCFTDCKAHGPIPTCNPAWLHVASAAEKNPSVVTSKKRSWSSVIPKTHKYSTLVCLICH